MDIPDAMLAPSPKEEVDEAVEAVGVAAEAVAATEGVGGVDKAVERAKANPTPTRGRVSSA
jgi:hypothetical protein